MTATFAKVIGTIVLSGGLASCSTLNKPSATSAAVGPASTQTALAFQADQAFGVDLTGTDRASLSSAERRALDYGKAGEPIGWNGKKSGVTGTIVASQPFRVGGTSCRRFEHKLTGATGASQTNGTACKRTDGNWRLVR